MARVSALVLALALAHFSSIVVCKSFLSEHRSRLDARLFQSEISEAMGMALGCGGRVGEEDLAAIETELLPIWRAVHKNQDNRVDRRLLRYLVHRYFDRRSALHVRGFEPSRLSNTSGWGDADILSQRVPAFVEAVLESKHKEVSGFDLRDAALMVATVQQLIFDSEGSLLEKAFKARSRSPGQSLSLQELPKLLEAYLVHWFLGDDEESISILLSNRSLLVESIPHWDKLVSMAAGHVQALEYRRQNSPAAAYADHSARPGHNAFASLYSFEDVHRVVGEITTHFASFWESECQSMKGALVDMDKRHTGRVPLSKFYSRALDTEWRFGESEAYLRDLGALDETGWRGKQVIIANYIQGASNCIVSGTHYLVCCVNECEALQGELEVAVGGPVASPDQIFGIVGDMIALDEDASAMQASLEEQLMNIAATHGGAVPLHGRLFAQWLHYTFPRECPFPHRAGTATTLTPTEFGAQHLAEGADMQRHAQTANVSDISADVGRDELQWMSQWSAEEELVSDQLMRGFRAPWEGRGYVTVAVMLVLLVGILGVRVRKTSRTGEDWIIEPSKSHFV